MKFIYILWAIIPYALTMFWLWALVKKWTKQMGQESASFYFCQARFALICFFVAIGVDHYLYQLVVDSDLITFVNHDIFRVLVYPAVLLLATYVQKLFTKKEEERPWYKQR